MSKKKRPFGKGFARRAILFSTLAMLALTAVGLVLYGRREAILAKQAERAAARGDYEKAISSLEAAEKGTEGEETLLQYRYALAKEALEKGDAARAETLFTQLGDYADSRTLILECRYMAAERALAAGDLEDAKDRFYALSGYRDALDRYDGCRYAIAEQTAVTDPAAGFALFWALGGYSDAKDRAVAIARQVTGEGDDTFAVNRMLGVSEEQVDKIKALRTVRERLPQGRLAVGFYHTVGLKADGTVVAAGRNDEGQCDVSAWTQIQAVACGAYHTVGLKADGTVVAVGRNDEGQCDVGGWTGVVALACADYNTLALLSDGTVLSTGYQSFSELSGWRDVSFLAAGSYGAVAISADGRVYGSHPSLRSEELAGAVAADVSTGYCVAVKEDGTVVHTALELPWENVVALSAATTGTLALTDDGRVLCHWFRARDALDFSDINGAVALSAGATHTAVLLSDGTVIARGLNDQGQCDTGSWSLLAAD